MKKPIRSAACLFILAFCFLPRLAAQQLPRPAGFVNDFAGVMKAADIEAAQILAAAIKEKTGAELAVVTVNSFAPYGSIDEYSIALAEEWGIGEKGKDNGVLILLAVAEREVKIEVGYGLEGAIPDSMAGRILDTAVIPAFREDDFSGGLVQGYRAIAACVAKEYGMDYVEADIPRAREIRNQPRSALGFPFSTVFIFSFIIIGMSIVQKKLKKDGDTGGYNSIGSFGSSFGGSDSSSSSSSDSFGGGSFGGGGASRDF